MSQVFFISDLHIGHKAIIHFARPQFSTLEEMHQWLIESWNEDVTKRDLVWVLGDIIFDRKYEKVLSALNGTKKLVLGNHDKFDIHFYARYFAKIHGMCFYEGEALLSHMPAHTHNLEYRVKYNIHGHIHDPKSSIRDPRYFNVCIDCIPNSKPVPYETIQKRFKVFELNREEVV